MAEAFHPAVDECVLGVVGDLAFPRPRGDDPEVVIRYPFVFEPAFPPEADAGAPSP